MFDLPFWLYWSLGFMAWSGVWLWIFSQKDTLTKLDLVNGWMHIFVFCLQLWIFAIVMVNIAENQYETQKYLESREARTQTLILGDNIRQIEPKEFYREYPHFKD